MAVDAIAGVGRDGSGVAVELSLGQADGGVGGGRRDGGDGAEDRDGEEGIEVAVRPVDFCMVEGRGLEGGKICQLLLKHVKSLVKLVLKPMKLTNYELD